MDMIDFAKLFDHKNAMTYTTSADPAKVEKPLTMDDLVALVKSMPPPPPPPDPHRCCNCKEEMREPSPITVGGLSPFGRPDGYLCGRCAYLVKRQFVYEPRNRATNGK